jgi:light-regulated signal transduction histidine kinase (bacteriophytochrome)
VLQIVARLKEPLGEHQPSVVVGDLPDCFGDRALLEQVLINLLSNAFKFSAGRDLPHIEVGALRQGADTVYYVRDNGVGFDMRYADKLFGVFQRLHPQEAFEGTGIGLSMAQRSISACPQKSGPNRREPMVRRSTRPRPGLAQRHRGTRAGL